VPREPAATEGPYAGDFPVDLRKLRQMVPPVLTHMLDAYFSSLVVESLAVRSIRSFFAIHDNWMVPAKVRNGLRVQDGRDVLRAVLRSCVPEWLGGLGTVYDEMLGYLAGTEFEEDVRTWQARWEARVAECRETGCWPEFRVKNTPTMDNPVDVTLSPLMTSPSARPKGSGLAASAPSPESSVLEWLADFTPDVSTSNTPSHETHDA
jgi:hypothetical protein